MPPNDPHTHQPASAEPADTPFAPDRPITRLDPARDGDFPADRPLNSARAHSLDALLEPPFDLITQQWAFVHSPARFSFYVGGIGSGKTTAGCLRAIHLAADQPGSLGLIGAPTYTMLRDTTQRMLLQLLPPWAIASYRQSDNHLTLINGSEILFRSLDDPDRLRGLNLAWFWLDEATLCGHYAWQVLKGRLRQAGYRTAATATGTPHGRDAYWRDFEAEPRPNHALYRATTADNAAHLPPDYIADLGFTGAYYDQEVLGLFTAFDGLVYQLDTSPTGNLRDPWSEEEQKLTAENAESAEGREDTVENHRRPSSVSSPAAPLSSVPSPSVSAYSAYSAVNSPSPSPRFVEVIGGIDWGYTNPAVGLVLARDGDDRWFLLEEFYQRRAALDGILLPALIDLTRRHRVSRWYAGPDDPGAIAALAAALAREQLPARVRKADNAVRPGIQTVTSLLAPRADGTRGLFISPRCVHTLSEFQSYAYASTDDGTTARPAAEEPIKQNDHALDALRYALHTAVSRQRRYAAQIATLRQRRSSDAPHGP